MSRPSAWHSCFVFGKSRVQISTRRREILKYDLLLKRREDRYFVFVWTGSEGILIKTLDYIVRKLVLYVRTWLKLQLLRCAVTNIVPSSQSHSHGWGAGVNISGNEPWMFPQHKKYEIIAGRARSRVGNCVEHVSVGLGNVGWHTLRVAACWFVSGWGLQACTLDTAVRGLRFLMSRFVARTVQLYTWPSCSLCTSFPFRFFDTTSLTDGNVIVNGSLVTSGREVAGACFKVLFVLLTRRVDNNEAVQWRDWNPGPLKCETECWLYTLFCGNIFAKAFSTEQGIN
jgi:hypothetical protein